MSRVPRDELPPSVRAAQRGGRPGSPRIARERAYPLEAADHDFEALQARLGATRALLAATAPEQVAAIVATFVHDLGGGLVPARLSTGSALPLDVSLGTGEPVLPWAEPVSVAEMRLSTVLPPVVEDARTVLHRLQTGQRSSEPVELSADGYFEALTRADPAAASAHVLALLDGGMPLPEITALVLAPAQVRVGRLWETGAWGVADEHAASAVTETALAALVAAARGTRTAASPAPHVLVACAEGDWHTLPARMAAAAAQDAGARVTFLGPSLPAEHLERRLQAGDVDVLALSCTLPTNLIGAARCIAAAHESGVPVVAGGRAFGPRGDRAFTIGADAFASTGTALAGPVPELTGRAVDVPAEALLLDATGRDDITLADERMVSLFPRMSAMTPWQRSRTREDLQWMARFAGAAVLTGDQTVLDDFLDWLCGLPDGKVTAAMIAVGAELVADAVEPGAPTGATMLRAAAARITDPLADR